MREIVTLFFGQAPVVLGEVGHCVDGGIGRSVSGTDVTFCEAGVA